MLKKIKVSNFYSIGAEQELSLEISTKDILDDSAVKLDDGTALNLVSCIVGSNASGKTNLLKVLSFLFWLVNDAYTTLKSEDQIPVEPHQFMRDQSIKIEVEFFNKNVFFVYKIEFNSKKILKERLEKKGMHDAVFELNRINDETIIRTHSRLKINEADERRFKERQNVPLLSSLIDTAYLADMVFFKNFKSNVNKLGTARTDLNFKSILNLSRELQTNNELRQQLLNFSKDIDLGLSDFKFSKGLIEETKEEVPILACARVSNKQELVLPLFKESNGTQHYFFLYYFIYPMLAKGGIVVLDEIESGLHMEVIKKIISLFENRESNPHHSQLIFSTHQAPLLNDRTKTQIFITEKNASLETEFYRLDDLEGIRNDENYFHKYIAGAYGGIPNINWLGEKKDG